MEYKTERIMCVSSPGVDMRAFTFVLLLHILRSKMRECTVNPVALLAAIKSRKDAYLCVKSTAFGVLVHI